MEIGRRREHAPCVAPPSGVANTMEMDPNETEKIPVGDLKSEEGAKELVDSETMRPYVRLAEAIMTRQGLKEAVAEIGDLPLEQRYLWRVLSALKWGFADFDSANLVVDRKTLRPEDRRKVSELIQHRPVQFCMLLKALLGDEAMEEMMPPQQNLWVDSGSGSRPKL